MKTKQGELPGYRSSVALAEGLKLGVFVSALVTDVDEHSVWTVQALDLLVPAVSAAAWAAAAAAPAALPSKSDAMAGKYYDGSVVIEATGAAPREVLLFEGVGETMNLTAIPGVDPTVALRATVVNSTDGCRWLDDGTNLELVYFDWDASNATVEKIRFMGATYDKLG